MILQVCWDGLWTLSFGLSQFPGHGSWLVYEVALICSMLGSRICVERVKVPHGAYEAYKVLASADDFCSNSAQSEHMSLEMWIQHL